MKRHLITAALALGAAALLAMTGTRAGAAEPPFAPLPAGVPTPAALTVEGPVVKAAATAAPAAAPVAAPVAAPAQPPAAGCAPACETTCLKKVCVPESATRVVRRRVYGEACEDFCLPQCSLTGGLMKLNLHGDCDGCGTPACGGCAAPACGNCGGCASCEKPRERKYLVVKIRSREECYTKCGIAFQPEEPRCASSCETKCHTPAWGHKGACCAGAVVVTDGAKPLPTPMPPAEKAPAPKEK